MLARSLAGETLGDEGLEVTEVHCPLHCGRPEFDDGGVIEFDALHFLAHDSRRASESLGAFGLGGVSCRACGFDHLSDHRAALEDEAESLFGGGLDGRDLLAALARLDLHALASGGGDLGGGGEELARLERLLLGGGGLGGLAGGLAHCGVCLVWVVPRRDCLDSFIIPRPLEGSVERWRRHTEYAAALKVTLTPVAVGDFLCYFYFLRTALYRATANKDRTITSTGVGIGVSSSVWHTHTQTLDNILCVTLDEATLVISIPLTASKVGYICGQAPIGDDIG